MQDFTRPITHPITGQTAPAYLHGVIVPMFTPCDNRNRIDERGVRAYVDYLIGTDAITTLFPRSGLGGMYAFRYDEVQEIIDIVTDQAKGRVPVMPGCGGQANDDPMTGDIDRYTRQSVELCEYARRRGAVAAVLPVPLFLLGGERRGHGADAEHAVLAYYRDVASGTELPIVIYEPPDVVQRFDTSHEFVEGVLAIPTIKGAKISSALMSIFNNIVLDTISTDFALISGDEEGFLFTMMIGGTAVIGQGSTTDPEILRAVYERMMSLDYPGATRAHLDAIRALHVTSRGNAVIWALQYLARKGVAVQPYTIAEGSYVQEQHGAATTAELDRYTHDLDALRDPYRNSIVR